MADDLSDTPPPRKYEGPPLVAVAVLREVESRGIDALDPLAVLALNTALLVDAGGATAADRRELRLALLDMRRTSAPGRGASDLDRYRERRRRRAAGRSDGEADPPVEAGPAPG